MIHVLWLDLKVGAIYLAVPAHFMRCCAFFCSNMQLAKIKKQTASTKSVRTGRSFTTCILKLELDMVSLRSLEHDD